MQILTAEQMGRADRLTSERYAIPSLILMENAGMNLYASLRESFEDLPRRRVGVVCGPGNNGGDGFVLARQLLQRDVSARVFLLGKREKLGGDAATNAEILHKAGGGIVEVEDLDAWMPIRGRLPAFDILVDAILGTGINRPVEPDSFFGAVIADLNASGAFILSVDIPSGLRSDRLVGGDLTVQADLTVTFSAPKIAHILNEDLLCLGDLHIVPIGTPAELLEEVCDPPLTLVTAETAASFLPQRAPAAHKGTFGRTAIIAGSRGKAGAAALASRAALRAGAGLVTAISPRAAQEVVASATAEVMTEGLADTESGVFRKEAAEAALEFLDGQDAAAMGPGIGAEDDSFQFARRIVEKARIPLVIDADGLNAFADCPEKLRGSPERPLILTPHPGEFARLADRPIPEIVEKRLEIGREFAARHEVWLVLKSFRTVVVAPDGHAFACPLGNAGMATAGMGDVLTGVLGAMAGMADSTDAEAVTRAVVLGVFLHSLAGDFAADELGRDALMAGDVIEYLGEATTHLRALADS